MMRNTLLIVVGLVFIAGAWVYSQGPDTPRDRDDDGNRETEAVETEDRGAAGEGEREGRRGRGPGGDRGGEGGRGGFTPPPNPFLAVFDTDKDGKLSKEEMDAAGEILAKMDKDEDGSLTAEELPDPWRDMMQRFRDRRGGGDRGGFGRRGGDDGGREFGRRGGGEGGREFGRRGGDEGGREFGRRGGRGRGGDRGPGDGFPAPPAEKDEEGDKAE